MRADAGKSQLFVVLYQSCPRRLYIRQTALRALCLLFFLYSLVFGIITAVDVSDMTVLGVLVATAVFDCAGVVLGCISVGFRVHHERCRVRDDMLRAGAGGDVRAQVARLESAHRGHDEDAASSAESPPLLLFKYANRRYWCVQPRRPDGDGPSTDECLEAAARETGRRKHDMDIGKAYFSMSIACTVLHLTLTVLLSIEWKRTTYPESIMTTRHMAMAIMSTIGAATRCVFIPITPLTGLSLARAPKPVPTGVMSVNLAGEDTPCHGTLNSRQSPQYQEALPGPPLEELELQTDEAVQREELDAHGGQRSGSVHEEEWHTKDGKTTRALWVWGGFANHESHTQPSGSSSAPAVSASFDRLTKPPAATQATQATQPTPAVTAPPADVTVSSASSFSARSSAPSSHSHEPL